MSHMQELMHLREYTRRLKAELPRELFQPVPSRLLWLIPHMTIITVSIGLIHSVPMHWAWKTLTAFIIGHSFACLGFLGHEVLHGSVVRTPWLRNLVGGICFAPFFLGPKLWRKWHNVEHHGHTQFEDDPDAMGTLEDFRERKSLQILYNLAPFTRSLLTFISFSFWFSLHATFMLRRFAKESTPRDRLIMYGQMAIPLAGAAMMAVWMRGDIWFAFVIPVLTANFIVMSYIATNHLLNPLTPTNDPLANSLTVIVPRWLDALHMHFSHHTEHHIFPAVNPKYAPMIKAVVKKNWPDRYNEMPHWKALLALWRTPRLYRDETSLIDPVRNLAYPTLGHGLTDQPVKPFKVNVGRPLASETAAAEQLGIGEAATRKVASRK